MLSISQQLYFAWDINHKKSTSDDGRFTGVLSESRVDLNPHQVEAALFAFKSPLSKGAILADEVGLGKTIEAGIIMSELWAERKRNILIIVPASLRNQWNLELLEKFYLPSIIMERSSYEKVKSPNTNAFSNIEKIIICSYNFAVAHSDELSEIHWDLVVFDEAHKLRNAYKKNNVTGNVLREALKPYKKVLLTATPLQNNLKELFGLISIIDDEFFSSVETFDEQYNNISTRDKSKYGELKYRISHIAHRTLRSQVQEFVKYTKRIPIVQEFYPSSQEKDLYNALSNYIFREGTYGVPEQYRPLLSLLYRKVMSSSAYALKYTLNSTIERLERLKKDGKQIIALSSLLSDIEGNEDDKDYLSENDKLSIELEDKERITIDKEIEELKSYIKMAESITDETKTKELIKALNISFEKAVSLGANHKAIIFTESRKTQDYLKAYLDNHGYKGKTVCFNGQNNSPDVDAIYKAWICKYGNTSYSSGNVLIDKKQAIVDYFKDVADIMIATEAGAEGINLQFCSIVINYDMPWNPQRIEQRIGRCHRYGQKHDVVVVNFVNKSNAADRRVYELLTTKYNLFEGVFGISDEIIGSLDSSYDIEKRLNDIYRECRTEDEINKAFDALQKELEEIIDERIKRTKKSLLENFDEDVVDKLKVRQENDNIRVDKYVNHFWKLSTQVLSKIIINVNEDSKSFILNNPISDYNIEAGKYTFSKYNIDGHTIRIDSPLGKYILDNAPKAQEVDEDITFDLTNYPYRTVILEEQKNKEGCLIAYKVSSVNKYDDEESLIICAITDDGDILPSEFAYKLLELMPISIREYRISNEMIKKTDSLFVERFEKFKADINSKMSDYANFEIDKFESWSDDKLIPLQNDVIKLRKEKDAIHRQIRKEHDVKAKLLLKREELTLGDTLRKKQSQLYEMEEKYRKQVDLMTSNLLQSLDCAFESSVFFKIHWRIV